MAVYDKSKHFSPGWMIGGTVLMFIFNFFGGFIAAAAGVRSIWVIVGIVMGAYALAGFVMGWQSEGQTIIEAGIAAVLSIAIIVVIRQAWVDPIALAISSALPFGAAVLGAWIGELVQGNEIVTDD